MKEHELLNKYRYSMAELEGIFDIVSQGIYNKRIDCLNLQQCKEKVEFAFEFLFLKDRFDKLVKANQSFVIDAEADKFVIYSDKTESAELFTCETLDELEKALQNKMFL